MYNPKIGCNHTPKKDKMVPILPTGPHDGSLHTNASPHCTNNTHSKNTYNHFAKIVFERKNPNEQRLLPSKKVNQDTCSFQHMLLVDKQ
jgi:hypothetical protein